jgi:hypothetical protein
MISILNRKLLLNDYLSQPIPTTIANKEIGKGLEDMSKLNDLNKSLQKIHLNEFKKGKSKYITF